MFSSQLEVEIFNDLVDISLADFYVPGFQKPKVGIGEIVHRASAQVLHRL